MKKHEKQHLALTPLIEEHNEVILLCERIREGLQNKIDTKRIKNYIDWFKTEYLDPHFEIEKQYIFPILGNKNFRIKRALANHRRMNRLFDETNNLDVVLNKIEEELGRYIRFEERILFAEVQQHATPEHWEELEKQHHDESFVDNTSDEFWK